MSEIDPKSDSNAVPDPQPDPSSDAGAPGHGGKAGVPECINHPGKEAKVFCMQCKAPLCTNCKRVWNSDVLCPACSHKRPHGQGLNPRANRVEGRKLTILESILAAVGTVMVILIGLGVLFFGFLFLLCGRH